jgi:DNA-binding NtrC family response regulator
LSPIRSISSRLDSLDARPRRSGGGGSGGGKGPGAAGPWIGALIRVSSTHPAMTHILDVIERLQDRPFRTNFLLVGEPGTGKDGLARALHELVAPGGPLIKLDVGGFPEEAALEALVGSGTRPGAAEQADRGTLLIEELVGLPARVQEALLRLLKSGRTRRLGRPADQPRRLTVNAIALTDGDPERAVTEGRLRHDLYHRLARVVLWLPPLRDRPDDLAAAAIWMGNRILSHARVPLDLRTTEDLRSASEDERRRAIELETSAVDALRAHLWPGNFRELEAALERALLLYRKSSRIGAAEVHAALASARPPR